MQRLFITSPDQHTVLVVSAADWEQSGCPYCGSNYCGGHQVEQGMNIFGYACGECWNWYFVLGEGVTESPFIWNGQPTALAEHPRRGIPSHGKIEPTTT